MQRNHKYLVVRQFWKITDEVISKIMKHSDILNEVLDFRNIDDSVECFNIVVAKLMDMICPLKTRRICSNSPPW